MVIKLFLKHKLMNRIKIFAIFLFSILSFYFVKQIDITNSSNVVMRIDKLIKKSEIEKYKVTGYNKKDLEVYLNNVAKNLGTNLSGLKEKFNKNQIN